MENCQAAYQAATDDLRRDWNQFAFVRVSIVIDGPPHVELTPTVETLVREGRRTYRRDAATPDHPQEDDQGSPELVLAGGGSYYDPLVGAEGLEPPASAL